MLTLIRNARVFAPQPLGICHLLIAGGEILWLGAGEISLPAALEAQTYDAAGRRLIPGLIDGHAHLTGGGGESGYASRVPAVPLSRFTRAGVTTVVGLLGTDDTTRTTQSLLAATRALRAEGMSAYCYTGGYHVPATTFTGSIRSDIINLDPVIGVGEVAISDHRSSQPTLDELLRIASEAHVAGMMTDKAGLLHLHLGDGPRGLDLVRRALDQSELPGRVFNPTHINRQPALLEEAIELTKRGCYVDITAFPVVDGDPAVPAAQALARLLDSDATRYKVTVSSDGGGCLPLFDDDGRITHMDIGEPLAMTGVLADMLRAGHDLETVLPAFTSNVATLLRLPSKGRLQAGSDADLVLLADDHGVDSVMIAGQWHRQDGKQLIKGNFE